MLDGLDELIVALIEDTYKIEGNLKIVPASVYNTIVLLRAGEYMYHELDECEAGYTEGQSAWDGVLSRFDESDYEDVTELFNTLKKEIKK